MRVGVAKTARESAKSPEEFQQKRQAIDYAETRACFRTGEISRLDQRMNRLAQETAVEHVGVGCDDLKDKTNAETN
jgi:hypothetical protein